MLCTLTFFSCTLRAFKKTGVQKNGRLLKHSVEASICYRDPPGWDTDRNKSTHDQYSPFRAGGDGVETTSSSRGENSRGVETHF